MMTVICDPGLTRQGLSRSRRSQNGYVTRNAPESRSVDLT